jgi:PIN domain nuclease of toxin-antitoxin system
VRLLLDTHVALWAAKTPERITADIRSLIEDPAIGVYVSAASIWEIAIKRGLGRGERPPFAAAESIEVFRRLRFDLLPISAEHAAAVEGLPRIHGDPFARLLVAQATVERMQLVTHDKRLTAYLDGVVLVG